MRSSPGRDGSTPSPAGGAGAVPVEADADASSDSGARGGTVTVVLVLAAVATLASATWIAVAPVDPEAAATTTALAALLDQGQSLRSDIRRVIEPAMARTRKLASSERVVAAVESGNREAATAACNEGVTGATEIDAFALFDRDGRVLAINTVYADGRVIAPVRVDRILKMDFEGREIIQRCARNESETDALEFQTDCDITPAFFDSTGLSVAYSTPVRDTSGRRVGVASARLRFERLTELVAARRVGGRSRAAYFLSDRGEYFSEEIARGEQPAPIPSAALASIVEPLVRGERDEVLTRHGADYVSVFRLKGFQTLDGGGIQVLLLSDPAWIESEVRHGALRRAAGLGVTGALLLAVAGAWRSARISARAGRTLRRQKDELEREIERRAKAEAERAALADRLLDASRCAGMAEVAAGVLHNVGNALNSVNVSATMAAERVRGLKIDSLEKAVAMLHEHSADLGTFIASDPRGQRLPGFMTRLAEHLTSEQAAVLSEMKVLAARLEHVKSIVNTQQAYARSGGMVEQFNVVDAIEDAMRMHLAGLERHGITVVREFEPLPLVTADRHRLVQILLNVFSNARKAMHEPQVKVRTLTVRACATADQRVRIEVRDTGVGIAPENLTRIFAHGFTTRKDGHGFGLHSAAIAAGELSGTLTAHSDGPGRGATFVLEWPLHPKEATR